MRRQVFLLLVAGTALLLSACGGAEQAAPTIDTQATVSAVTKDANATVVTTFGTATTVANQQGTITAQVASLQTAVVNQQAAGTAQADGFAATTTAIGISQQSTATAQQDQATQSARATLTAPTSTPAATATPRATATPSVTATPSATSTPSATATPVPKPITTGTVLYQSDWSTGSGGWATPAGWKTLNGTLLNDGTSGGDSVRLPAPFQPASLSNYAIEMEMQIVRYANNCGSFGLFARTDYQAGFYGCGGYEARIANRALTNCCEDRIAAKDFNPKSEYQTYRMEVQGNEIRLLVNGALVVAGADNRNLAGGQAGIICNGFQITIRSVRIIAL